ncbi:unnamed protein product [Rhodiola kirilowii]
MRDSILQSLKEYIQRARTRMEQHANSHRQHKEFTVGDWVYVRLQPYRQSSVCPRRSNKLDRCFYGSFAITARVGTIVYCLALPPHAKIHNVFHISLLRKCINPATSQSTTMPDSFVDFCPAPQPEYILAHRRVKTATGWSDQLLVQWSGEPASAATWEIIASIHEDFPAFDLDAKVAFDDGGNVTCLHDDKGASSGTAAADQRVEGTKGAIAPVVEVV